MELGGIGACELGGTDDWRNRRDQNRSSRSVEERSAARIGINENPEDGRGPGKLNGKAATLQEKRGLSRYGERYKGKGWDDGRWERREKGKKGKEKGIWHGEHYEGRENKGERGNGEHYEGRENKGGRGTGSTTYEGNPRGTQYEEHVKGRGETGPQQYWEETKRTEER
ncbi:hypothetical protein NDU88_000061 [Pleurodeles waltl]|uniref:Uncharacterized protein n=1 Tax=Pleurodeles waltl TaxID=8319 RepID=A0AAV7TED2_PLEWA|nr:hypothetical protein NDU88_000061 [Pleurodeles waltl]